MSYIDIPRYIIILGIVAYVLGVPALVSSCLRVATVTEEKSLL